MQKSLRKIRAVTLDLDDTLWAIEPVIRRAEAMLWRWLTTNFPRVEKRWSPERLVELRSLLIDDFPNMTHDFRFLRKQGLERIALDSGYTADLVEPAFAVFDAERNNVELFPEVLAELDWLAEHFTLIAVTNGNADLRTIGIARYFDGIVTAASAGAAKPARPIFEAAIEHAGMSPSEVLHVGDHAESDVQGARNAGMRTVWVNRAAVRWPENVDAPDATVDNMSGLRDVLHAAVVAIREKR